MSKKLIYLLLALSLGVSLIATDVTAQLPPRGMEFAIADEDTVDVDTIDHRPRFVLPRGYHPRMRCVPVGSSYLDSIWISDYDLSHSSGAPERLTIKVLEPAGFQVVPNVILGPLPNDTVKLFLLSSRVPDTTGYVNVLLEVREKSGFYWFLSLPFHAVREPGFTMPVLLRSFNLATAREVWQTLTFGVARDATTGSESDAIGHLDSHYCEFELPPAPPTDVFDARWKVEGRLGVLRNIYPERTRDGKIPIPWSAGFNAGGGVQEHGYPVNIEWSKSDAMRAPWALTLADELADIDAQQGLFFVNMRTGAYTAGTGIRVESFGSDSMRVIVNLTAMRGFKIIRHPTTEVSFPPPNYHPSAHISAVYSPSSKGTPLNYYIPAAADRAAIEIVDARGRTIRTLELGRVEQGKGDIVWNWRDDGGAPVASGLYLCRLSAGPFTASCRTLVTR